MLKLIIPYRRATILKYVRILREQSANDFLPQ